MFEKIISLENLFSAWHEFRCGKQNRPDVQKFERNLEDNIFILHEDLKNGNYYHGKYHCFHLFDPKHRVIHKAMVRDRLVHHAVYRVLLPIFEKGFIFDSYSCRVGKGTHAAVRRLQDFVCRVSKNYSSPCFALKFDIKKFFDSVDHEILLAVLKRKIADQKTVGLLSEIIGSFQAETPWGGGVRQG
ncbi:MAG: reverse transcriptase domain-containing protein [Candidatus Uhrbacteria bacterium]